MIPWLEICTGLIGLLTTISLGLCGWALLQCVNQRVKVAELTAHVNATAQANKEAREAFAHEIDRRFLERSIERDRESNRVFLELEKIDKALGKLHERIDDALKAK